MVINPKMRIETSNKEGDSITIFVLKKEEYKKVKEGDKLAWRMKGYSFIPSSNIKVLKKLKNNEVLIETIA